MAGPSVFLTRPVAPLFHLPPAEDPLPLAPPSASSSFAPLFTIPEGTYAWWLQPRVPLTIGLTYATTVVLLNRVNKSRNFKAWEFSKTKAFFWTVILHNVFLAVYSGWTFIGMVKTLSNSVPAPWRENGLAGTIDGLCNIHGKPGLGNSVFYSTSSGKWTSWSSKATFTSAGLPDANEHGRMWNEGLAFYGWLFYLSKFYEVVDTIIILAKGKRSSTLQTYHHTGAMLCMWAGIRYMTPPIWVFCLFNSFIHALMYTYYSYTGLGLKVPQAIKQSLTSMQITQFLVGGSLTAIHLFLGYTLPVSSLTILKSPTHLYRSSDIASRLKKLGLRAIGEGATAAKIPSDPAAGNPFWKPVDCVDTEGKTFAIWLNILYLTPLTYLFARFFVKSYIKPRAPSAKAAIGNGRAKVANGSANGHTR